MPRNELPSPSIAVGALAAAATTGALIAIGHRLGGAGLPFAAIGAALFHETVSGRATGLIVAGLVAHVIAVFAWSWIAVWLVRARHWRVEAAALAVVVAAHLFSWIDAWWTGAGLASAVTLGDRIVLAAVFAGALVVGMRFAPPVSQSA